MNDHQASEESLREHRAEHYFTHDLAGQRKWYSDHANALKKRGQLCALIVLATGAAVTFLQIFGNHTWEPVATALCGGLVAIVEGWRQIARYDETWAAYRVASERMKREKRLYVNGAGAYKGLSDEEAFLVFIETIETIIAEEQRQYWSARAKVSRTSASRSPGQPEHPHREAGTNPRQLTARRVVIDVLIANRSSRSTGFS